MITTAHSKWPLLLSLLCIASLGHAAAANAAAVAASAGTASVNSSCPFSCFIHPDDRSLFCDQSPSVYVQPSGEPQHSRKLQELYCDLRNLSQGFVALNVGNGETVHHIQPTTLSAVLYEADVRMSHLMLSLNIQQLTQDAFQGLEPWLDTVILHHVDNLTVDAFVNLQQLKNLQFQRQKPTVLPAPYIVLTARNVEQRITTTLQVSCHRCVKQDNNNNDDSSVVLVLVLQSEQGALSMDLVQPKACQVQAQGEGCPKGGKKTTTPPKATRKWPYSPSSSSSSHSSQPKPTTSAMASFLSSTVRRTLPRPWPKEEPSTSSSTSLPLKANQERVFTAPESFLFEALLPMSIVLSVWCTFLTFILLVILAFLWKRFRLVRRLYGANDVIITDNYSFADQRYTPTPMSARHYSHDTDWVMTSALTRDSRKASSSTILT